MTISWTAIFHWICLKCGAKTPSHPITSPLTILVEDPSKPITLVLSKRADSVPRETSEDLLEALMTLLKSYVKGPFANPTFDDIGLYAKLIDIKRLFRLIFYVYSEEEQTAASARDVDAKYDFAQLMLRVTLEVYDQRHTLSLTPPWPTNATVMIEKLAAIRAYLLGLFDTKGVPDPSVDSYAETLSYYTENLPVWKQEFMALGDERAGLQEYFDKQYSEVEATVKKLASCQREKYTVMSLRRGY
ncbi:hypothetical protein JCM33374_g2281 [Metschnikowia sp. JCM 33374]|nr:hypothetical protein JCM33374_g2281 [Metschnikowia sp. JCM 33374]